MSRRIRHPLPLPPRGGGYATEIIEAEPVFGPQAKLCRLTRCCICHAIEIIRGHRGAWDPSVMRGYDWSQLPSFGPHFGASDPRLVIEAHHEPPRTTRQQSTDRDTIPMCSYHHRLGWTLIRHPPPEWSARKYVGGLEIYRHTGVDWRAVRDEMRARVRR